MILPGTLRLPALAFALALAACHSSQAPTTGGIPGDTGDTAAYDGIREGETVHFTGTEPFWGGQVTGAALTYSTPENQDGARINVDRFAGRGGVSWSGSWQGKPFRLAVTEGTCSDGMSDRSYPFTATLQVMDEQRDGCAWTDRRPATMPDGATAP